jgi:hypothetical protein
VTTQRELDIMQARLDNDGEPIRWLTSIPKCPECDEFLTLLEACYWDALSSQWVGWRCVPCDVNWSAHTLIDLLNGGA